MQPFRSHYEKATTATEYRGRFSKSWTRRLSHRIEMRMLAKALDGTGATDRMLDVPCGAGRLIGELVPRTRQLVCADLARTMIDEARRAQRRPAGSAEPGFAQASAFALPFADRAFDVAVCWRLIHHFADPSDRRRILLELRRVTRRAIVMSFWDAGTARGRRILRRGRASARVAVTRSALAEEIAACGLRVERFYRLFGPFSAVGAVRVSVPQ